MVQDHLAIPVLYASSWLLTAFASDFPIFFASRVMDIILTDRYVVAIMKVCIQGDPMHACCGVQSAASRGASSVCGTSRVWGLCVYEHLLSCEVIKCS